jgi:translation elongation factor EF-G
MNVDLDDDVTKTYDIRTIPKICIFNKLGKLVASFGREQEAIENALKVCIAQNLAPLVLLGDESEYYGDIDSERSPETIVDRVPHLPIVKPTRVLADEKKPDTSLTCPIDTPQTCSPNIEDIERDLNEAFNELEKIPEFPKLAKYIEEIDREKLENAGKRQKVRGDREFET